MLLLNNTNLLRELTDYIILNMMTSLPNSLQLLVNSFTESDSVWPSVCGGNFWLNPSDLCGYPRVLAQHVASPVISLSSAVLESSLEVNADILYGGNYGITFNVVE